MNEQSQDRTSATLLKALAKIDNNEAWHRFVTEYAPRIHARVRSWGLQESDAADVAAQVLLRLVQALPSFEYDRDQRFRGWLRTVVDNEVRKFIRSRRAHPANVGSGDSDIQERLNQEPDRREDQLLIDLLEDMFGPEVTHALDTVRRTVEAKTFESFRLRVEEGLTPAEIAETLNISLASAYKNVTRIAKRVREELRRRLDPREKPN